MSRAGFTCPRCGAVLERNNQAEERVCEYCGYRFLDNTQWEQQIFAEISRDNPKTEDKTAEPKREPLFLIVSIFSLIIGTIVYLQFRPQAYVSQFIYHILKISAPGFRPQGAFVTWINNFLPDILWAFALTFAAVFVLGCEKKQLVVTGIFSVCVEVGSELLQKLKVISGTFDLLDILAEVITTSAALLIIILYSFFRRKKHEKTHYEGDQPGPGADAVRADGCGKRFIGKE